MLFFYIALNQAETEALFQELAKARQRGNLTIVQRIQATAEAENGTSIIYIAQIIKVSPESVRSWVKKYLVSGIKGLIPQKKSPGRPSKLTKSQRRELEQIITEGPLKAGFSGACWRSPMIQELIFQRFNIFYNTNYISSLLKQMGFSYQKARFDIGGKNLDNQAQRQDWLEKQWPEAYKKALNQKAYLFFEDEVSFPQWGTLNYTWAKSGKQPLIKTSGIRKGYKVFGMIDYFTGKFFHKSMESKINSETYIDFLKDILSKTRKHIVLIHDGASYHKSKKVTEFLKSKNRLTIYKLPPYSPDFNPIEKIWKKIKTTHTHLQYFPTFDSLKEKVDEALGFFAKQGTKLLSVFQFYQKMSIA